MNSTTWMDDSSNVYGGAKTNDECRKTETHEGTLAEVLKQQGIKGHVVFHIFHDININAETSERVL